MKIYNEQAKALQQQQEQQKGNRANKGQGEFGNFLAREIGKGDAKVQATPKAPPPPLGVQALLGTKAAASAADKPAETSIMRTMEQLLSKWENYASQLDYSESSDLRQAYSQLEQISGELRQLKDNAPNLASDNPALASMVEELEILAVTEQVKFNRGDYL